MSGSGSGAPDPAVAEKSFAVGLQQIIPPIDFSQFSFVFCNQHDPDVNSELAKYVELAYCLSAGMNNRLQTIEFFTMIYQLLEEEPDFKNIFITCRSLIQEYTNLLTQLQTFIAYCNSPHMKATVASEKSSPEYKEDEVDNAFAKLPFGAIPEAYKHFNEGLRPFANGTTLFAMTNSVSHFYTVNRDKLNVALYNKVVALGESIPEEVVQTSEQIEVYNRIRVFNKLLKTMNTDRALLATLKSSGLNGGRRLKRKRTKRRHLSKKKSRKHRR